MSNAQSAPHVLAAPATAASRVQVWTDAQYEELLQSAASRTGVTSEPLLMGTLLAWIMRPQPELRDAIGLYGAQLGLGAAGGARGSRHRHVAMHVRHGDKVSTHWSGLGARNAWRTNATTFMLWGRRVASLLGATRVLYMSDDKAVVQLLSSEQRDKLFVHVPSRLECIPIFRAGYLGWGEAQTRFAMVRQGKATDALPTECGPAHLADDGIQFFAGLALLSGCAAFIGTQVSNVDRMAVELMSVLRHPPVVFDVLNDVYRALFSNEVVFHGGIGNRRPISQERLAYAAS